MKKTIKIFFSVFCASAVLAACAKEAVQEKEGAEDQQIITAYVNANPTKLAYEEIVEGGGAGMTSTWQNGDHFLAIQDGEKVVDFQLISGAGTTQGVFQTLTSGVTSTTQWVGVVGNGAEAHSSEIHCPYMGQNGTIKSLGGFNYVKVTATGEEPYFNFAEGEGLSYVIRVKLPEGVKCIEYTPCAWTKITTDAMEVVYYNSGEQSDFSAKNTTTITLPQVSVKGDLIYIALPLVNNSMTFEIVNSNKQYQNFKTGVVITLLNNDSDNADASNGTIFEGDVREKGGLISTFDLSEMTLIPRPKPSEAIKFTDENLSCAPHASALKQAVSSVETYWAPFEVGASKVGEAGAFYMFGMYEPYKGSASSFDEYKYHGTIPGHSTDRYCSIGYKHNKFADNSNNTTFFSVESSRYDTARIIWGCAWRMPHCIEQQGLLSSTLTVETVDGQNCVKCTNGATNNVIYLPIVGCYLDANHKDPAFAEIVSANKVNRADGQAGWDGAYNAYFKNDLSSKGFDRYTMAHALNVLPVLASSVIE